ncbi:MAG TPA: 50S ribosomal protein L28 [Candidatus Acetothermia bacterium]|nr:50S ribosomal protein L28 [Candidatus Bipolaricaulota bacterium]HHE51438.1 50S ribosomal protein L28 [Candidatus Acetothermia bacterium]
MSQVCDICGKRPSAGNQVSHSMRHTRRVRMPNIQRVHAYVDGKKVWINACTRCIKSGKVKKVV